MSNARGWLILLLLGASATVSVGDQPIMNMMPRWDGGWGVQGSFEHRHNPRLLDGRDTVNPDLSEDVFLFHLEGVYTWTKEYRMTLKIPFLLDAERETPVDPEQPLGETTTQRDSGIGDATLSFPLKKYFNEDGRSGSWSLVPQVRIPLDHEDDEFEFFDGAWGNGVAFGYEVETTKTFFAAGTDFWTFYGDWPNEVHLHLDAGLNFLDRGQALIESDFLGESDGSRTIMAGPAIYWRFTDVMHSRLEYKQALYDDQGDGRRSVDHGDTSMVKVGLGFVF